MKNEPALSEAIAWQLVLTLYNQSSTLVVGGLALPIVALIGWAQTGQIWYVVWACAMVVSLAGRLGLQSAFLRRREGPDRVAVWGRRFTVGAWLTGLLWGCAAFGITAHADPLVEILLIAGQMVIIMGAAARNAGYPPAVYGQVALSLLPLLVASVIDGDRNYWLLCFFIAFEAFAAISIARHLHRQTVQFLRANEQNVTLVSEVSRANAELARVNEQLAAAATTDALTGIANRRRFDDAVAEETRRAGRDATELCLLMIDIDAFKAYNDRYGHLAGDECLRCVAASIHAALRRPGDLVARYGGEEFAAILPRTDVSAAFHLAQTIRSGIEALEIHSPAGPIGAITVSIGVAAFDATRHLRPEDVLHDADEALYEAKHAGRNSVRVAVTLPVNVQ